MPAFRILSALFLLLAAPALSAQPAPEPDEAQIRGVIGRWYAELAKGEEGQFHQLVAPGLIDTSPHVDYIDNGAAVLGPRIYTHMSLNALEFAYDILSLRADASFAKVDVEERGYYYAAAAQRTYSRTERTTFVLEKQPDDGRWQILAHQSGTRASEGPLPDLRALYYATEGKHRDPEADARKAREF